MRLGLVVVVGVLTVACGEPVSKADRTSSLDALIANVTSQVDGEHYAEARALVRSYVASELTAVTSGDEGKALTAFAASIHEIMLEPADIGLVGQLHEASLGGLSGDSAARAAWDAAMAFATARDYARSVKLARQAAEFAPSGASQRLAAIAAQLRRAGGNAAADELAVDAGDRTD
ncbi:MAG: hypothetical protein ACI9MR_002014 [Myxococcota bacterium]|jgi:hypothetical protein